MIHFLIFKILDSFDLSCRCRSWRRFLWEFLRVHLRPCRVPWQNFSVYTHTTRTQTNRHTHTHTQAHKHHTHRQTPKSARTHMHTHMHSNTLTHAHTHAHTNAHTRTHTHTHTRTHTYTHAHRHAHTHKQTNAHTHNFFELIFESFPYVPHARYAPPPVTEHVPVHNKSLNKKNSTCVSGCK